MSQNHGTRFVTFNIYTRTAHRQAIPWVRLVCLHSKL